MSRSAFTPLLALVGSLLLGVGGVRAETVGVDNQPIYVTRADCMAMVSHHPSPDVTYQPGTDVNGQYVPPADLPGSGAGAFTLPDKMSFDIRINPMGYAQGHQPQTSQGQNTTAQTLYGNTSAPVAHVDVDLKNNSVSLNGKSLTSQQEQIVLEACRRAGFR